MWRRIPEAVERGAAEAREDIPAGRLRLFSGVPPLTAWGRDLAEAMRSRFGVEVVFVSDITWDEKLSFEDGYNSVVEAHVDAVWGDGSVAAVHAAVQDRRKRAHDAYFASRSEPPGENPTTAGP